MATMLDSTRPVREGEEIDLDRLREYLQTVLPGTRQRLALEQFPGGHSNLTYLLRYGDDEFVLRRPPRGSKVKSAHDMGREVRVLSKLCEVYDKAPKPVVFCEDERIIGAKFYLMNRLRGVILRKEPAASLQFDASIARKSSEALVDTLAELHTIDYAGIGLADFGRPDGYVERQVTGWTKRYHGSKTDDIPVVLKVAAWLRDAIPTDSGAAGATLIHNDFKYDNLVLDPTDLRRIIGVLDWEMTTVGDPLMDLGTALCYWVESSDPQPMQMMRFGPTHLPGMLTRRQVAERYAQKTGCSLENIIFYYAFGLFKTAVVAQQIYYRFKQGLTKDPRFAQMIHAVQILGEKAVQSVETGEL